jgi:hypothetical protein
MKDHENETMKVKRVFKLDGKHTNGLQLVLHERAEHKCIGHLQV